VKRFLCELSDELGAAIDAALAGRQRNPTLETWLWRVREIQDAAKQLGVRKPVRRGRGRPRKPPASPA